MKNCPARWAYSANKSNKINIINNNNYYLCG